MKLLLSLVAPIFIAALVAQVQASNNGSFDLGKFTISEKSNTNTFSNEKDDMEESSSDEKMSLNNDNKYNNTYYSETFYSNEDIDETDCFLYGQIKGLIERKKLQLSPKNRSQPQFLPKRIVRELDANNQHCEFEINVKYPKNVPRNETEIKEKKRKEREIINFDNNQSSTDGMKKPKKTENINPKQNENGHK